MAKNKKDGSAAGGGGREGGRGRAPALLESGEPAGLLGAGGPVGVAGPNNVAGAIVAAEQSEWGSPIDEDDEGVYWYDRGTGTYLDYNVASGQFTMEVPNPANEDNPYTVTRDRPIDPAGLFERGMGAMGYG